MTINKKWIRVGSFLGFLVVAIGAFGAHYLKPILEENGTTEVFRTGLLYHLFHVLPLLMIAFIKSGGKLITWAGISFVTGTLLFSGSLYVLAISGIRVIGSITPLGGLLFLAGWSCLFVSTFSKTGFNETSS